jgi:hypothetical protein
VHEVHRDECGLADGQTAQQRPLTTLPNGKKTTAISTTVRMARIQKIAM